MSKYPQNIFKIRFIFSCPCLCERAVRSYVCLSQCSSLLSVCLSRICLSCGVCLCLLSRYLCTRVLKSKSFFFLTINPVNSSKNCFTLNQLASLRIMLKKLCGLYFEQRVSIWKTSYENSALKSYMWKIRL